MLADLVLFNSGIEQLRQYIIGLDIELELLSHDTSNENCTSAILLRQYQQHHGQGVNKRQFDYRSVIVSLYGYLEKFVEALLSGYIENLNKIVPDYSALPKRIAANHLGLSIAFMEHVIRVKHNSSTTHAEIIANLHSCNVSEQGYVLNKDAFAFHTANFRRELIDRSFSRIEIGSVCERVKLHSILASYVDKFFSSQNDLSVLDDLADRRNQVAHGELSDLLQNQILLQYLGYVEAFGQSLFAILQTEILSYETQHICVKLGKPYHVYNRGPNSIPCLELTHVSLTVGDRLIVMSPANHNEYFEGEVQEIQVNKVSYRNVIAYEALRVGIKVPFHATTSQVFYLRPPKASIDSAIDSQMTLPFEIDEEDADNEYEPLDKDSGNEETSDFI